jgi:hypothetical protein
MAVILPEDKKERAIAFYFAQGFSVDRYRGDAETH